MKRQHTGALCALVMLTGSVSYEPVPLEPVEVLEQLQSIEWSYVATQSSSQGSERT